MKSGESFRLDSSALTVKQNKTMMTTNTGVNLQNLQVTSSIPTKISRVKLQYENRLMWSFESVEVTFSLRGDFLPLRVLM